MKHYMVCISFTDEAWQAWLKAPHSCEAKINMLAQEYGGSLLGFWWSHGTFDNVLIVQMPNYNAFQRMSDFLKSMGGFARFKVSPLLTDAEALAQLREGQKPTSDNSQNI